MLIREKAYRAWARIVGPISARIMPASGILKIIDGHLDAGRITVSGQMVKVALSRFGPQDAFKIRLARYHYARSEWKQVLESLSEGGTSEVKCLLQAKAALNLKQFDQAIEYAKNAESIDGIWLLIDLSLRQRNTAALAKALDRLIPETSITASENLEKLFRKPHFRFYLHKDRSEERKYLLSYFGPRLQRAFALFSAANGSVVKTLPLPPKPSNADPVFQTLNALAMGVSTGRKLRPAKIIQPDWLNTLYQWMSPRTLSRIFRLTNLSLLQLVEIDPTLDEVSAEQDDGARFLLDFIDIQCSLDSREGLEEPGFRNQLLSFLKSDRLSIVDGGSLLQNLDSYFSGTDFLLEGVKSFINSRDFKQDSALSCDFAESFVWMDTQADLRPLYDQVVNIHSASKLTAIESTTLERRIMRFGDGLKSDPGDFHFRRLAIREALRQDRPTCVMDWIASAKRTKLLSRENIAQLHVDAQNWTEADQAFEALGPTLSASARRDWMRSLFQRGHISKAMSIDPTGTGLEARYKEAETAISELKHSYPILETLNGVNDLIPILVNMAAEIDSTAKGTTLITSTLRPGGAERQVKATALGLAKVSSQDPLRVLCRSLDPAIQADFFCQDIEAAHVEVAELDMPVDTPMNDRATQLFALLPDELREIALPLYLDLCRHKPKIVHLWQDRIALAGAFAALLAGTPRIIMSLRSTRPDARRRYRPYQQQLFGSLVSNWPERIVIVNNSGFGARDYEDWLNLPKETIKVIRNGFDIEGVRSRAISSDNSPKMKPCLLGWVGRFTFEKRPDLWTDVAIALAKADPDFRAIAAGNGPLLSVQRSQVEKQGLTDQIQFLGNVRPIEPLMSKFSVLLLTSDREGLPNVLVEAQTLGVPVVTTDAGGASEAVNHGKTGLVIKGERPTGALIEAVTSIIYDPVKRREMSFAAQKWAADEFSLERMVDRTLAVFEDGNSL